ncbi:MAG: quinone-dependent dihydroorotate dehydrogenase [Thiolinea sp.]
MYSLLRDLLFLLPAETAHYLSLNSLKLAARTGLLGSGTALPGRATRVMGIDFPNPVGLAAGLDKNGEYVDAMAALGFGFIEVGTVTPRPQPGNPLPRLFRLPAARGLINRMGFNNHGLDYLLGQLAKTRYQGVLGINIGKNFDTPVERAADDYLLGLERVYTQADYITVNISSPNTPGLRTLQYGAELEQLLIRLKARQAELADQHGRYVPLAVKVAPDLQAQEIAAMAEVFLAQRIDGLIATNTTLDKSAVEALHHGQEQGGLSGQPLTQASTAVIRAFHQHLQDEIPIIGVGGIMSGKDAQDKLDAGARLVQVYSGFIYAGPRLVRDCVHQTA